MPLKVALALAAIGVGWGLLAASSPVPQDRYFPPARLSLVCFLAGMALLFGAFLALMVIAAGAP